MFTIKLLTGPGTLIDKLAILIGFISITMFSIISHEISHGYAALLNGDTTAKENGRLKFNPSHHFEPLGTIMFFLVGFGWAKPIPVNSSNFNHYKKGMITVSLAGIVTNCLIAGLLLCVYFFALPLFYKFASNIVLDFLKNFFYTFIVIGVRINFMLALFNLLPIYPLDGYNFIATLLPRCIGYQKFMIKWGQIIIFVIVALGIVGRYTNIPWLDLFGSYDDLIIKLLNKVEIASIKFYWGS